MPNTGTPEQRRRQLWTKSILSKERSRAAFVFRPRISSCFPRRNCLGGSPLTARRRLHRAEADTALRSISANSTKAISSSISNTVSAVFSELIRETRLQADANASEVLAIEFADEARLYVPLEQAYLVSRYVGVGKKSPPLSSLADAKWARAKKNAAASIFDYAGKMLALQAERETQRGHAFGPDTKWQTRIRAFVSFSRNAGPADGDRDDQERHGSAAPDGSPDLRRRRFRQNRGGDSRRVQSGDGRKTSRGARADHRARAAAFRNFPPAHARLSGPDRNAEPVPLARGAAQGAELLREGGVDIVIGTHRLISGDVVFKDLGLVVIDEEQRFGVLHKEKFKELFKLVDVLTLSATPIPRTLYLSLVGVKDMSTIETPPLNRLAGRDGRLRLRRADHPRRDQSRARAPGPGLSSCTIACNRSRQVRDRIAELCPEARVEFGHGQMDADELEAVMARFVAGKIDVLVCTTIIESGLDIPNANTIIIDRADRFGLADLYQLRGRVGRAEHKAYAYLLLPREMMTVGAARKRINAIKQYSSLGAGFRIAMRDLEIRGAGSILGTAQSGHIMAVGFDLYCQLLKQAVAQIKGEKLRARLEVEVRLDFVATNEAEFVADRARTPVPAFIPTSYVSDSALRIQAYRAARRDHDARAIATPPARLARPLRPVSAGG